MVACGFVGFGLEGRLTVISYPLSTATAPEGVVACGISGIRPRGPPYGLTFFPPWAAMGLLTTLNRHGSTYNINYT